MDAGLKGIEQQMLHAYTMAFLFVTTDEAKAICRGGIPTIADGARQTLTLCLNSPCALDWQKHAGALFKHNVGQLLGITPTDVQAMVIVGVPTSAIDQAGCIEADTVTITEPADERELEASDCTPCQLCCAAGVDCHLCACAADIRSRKRANCLRKSSHRQSLR